MLTDEQRLDVKIALRWIQPACPAHRILTEMLDRYPATSAAPAEGREAVDECNGSHDYSVIEAGIEKPCTTCMGAEAVGEREAFEAWFKTSGIWNDVITWRAWQARAALATAPTQYATPSDIDAEIERLLALKKARWPESASSLLEAYRERATAPTKSDDEDRAAFEKWAVDAYGPKGATRDERFPNSYLYSGPDDAWAGWQARAALATAPTPCKGKNCNAADGVSHSPECQAEHTATVAVGDDSWMLQGEDRCDDCKLNRSARCPHSPIPVIATAPTMSEAVLLERAEKIVLTAIQRMRAAHVHCQDLLRDAESFLEEKARATEAKNE